MIAQDWLMVVAMWVGCGVVGFGARVLSYEPPQLTIVARWRTVRRW